MIGRLKALAPPQIRAVARWAVERLPLPRKPAILMYHRIGRETFDPWGLAVEQQLFEQQLQWLAHNRSIVPLSELARRHREGRLSNDLIAITFDDGYAATLRAAVPLLEKFGVHATVFLPAGLIGRCRAYWWDELARIVVDFKGARLKFDGESIVVPPPDERDALWPSGAAPATPRQKLFQSMRATLRPKPPEQIERIMEELRRQARPAIRADDRPLTVEEVGSIPAQIIGFGSHALTHACLPALDDRAKIREVREGRRHCASLTGREPIAFAYPFGEYDRSIMRIVEDAGFECAVTSDRGFVRRRSNIFALPRLRIGNRLFG